MKACKEYEEATEVNTDNWENSPITAAFWGGGEPVIITKHNLQHLMTGKLVGFSDDGEYSHHIKLSDDAIEWLKGINK